MKNTLMISFAAALGLSGAALAQNDITLADIDANDDGVLNLEEVQAAAPEVTEVEFTAYDTNADGSLDEDEFQAWLDYKAGENSSEDDMDSGSNR